MLFGELHEHLSPSLVRRRDLRLSVAMAKILDRVVCDPFSGCWLCSLPLTYGYCTVRDGVGFKRAHRVVYEVFHGPVGAGLLVLHRCDVRNCVAPHHLWVGSYADNSADCVAKRRTGVARRPVELRTVRGTAAQARYESARFTVSPRSVVERSFDARLFQRFNEPRFEGGLHV